MGIGRPRRKDGAEQIEETYGDPILEELVKEDRIKMTLGKDGDIVSLSVIGR